MLRSHAELVGLQSNFTILDTDDQLRLLKQLISASNLDEKRWPARQLASVIDQWKNRGLTPAQISPADSEAFANGRGQELYAAYQDRLPVDHDKPITIHEEHFQTKYKAKHGRFEANLIRQVGVKNLDLGNCIVFMVAVPDINEPKRVFAELNK